MLGYEVHTVKTARQTLDRLGLDVPAIGNDQPVERPALEELSLARANPEAMRQQLRGKLGVQQKLLTSAPAAEVSERDEAAGRIAEAESALDVQPFVAATANAALKAATDATARAHDAIERLLAVHRELLSRAEKLFEPPETDKDGAGARDTLLALREKIGGALTKTPSAEGDKAAAAMIDEYESGAEALRRQVAERLARRCKLMGETVAALMSGLGDTANVDPALLGPVQELQKKLTTSIEQAAPTVREVANAEAVLERLREDAEALGKQLAALRNRRGAISKRLEEVAKATVSKVPWAEAAQDTLKAARETAERALGEKLSPDALSEADARVTDAERYAALIPRAEEIWRKALALMKGITLKTDATTAESQPITACGSRIRVSLGLLTQTDLDAAEGELKTFDGLLGSLRAELKKFSDDYLQIYETRKVVEKGFQESLGSAWKIPAIDSADYDEKFGVLLDLFDSEGKKPRNGCDQATLRDLVEQAGTVEAALQEEIKKALLPPEKPTGPLQIGYDPNTEFEKIWDAYNKSGGMLQATFKGTFKGICTANEKAGGDYIYKGVSYPMRHTSKGSVAKGVPSYSVWTVVIDGKTQVVGAGHHVGSGPSGYNAHFPLANVDHNGGPSPTITDPRT